MANNPEMTEEVRLILKRVFPGINVENMPHSEPVGMGRFPCERCGGTGWITVYHNMQPMKMRCPMCRAERDKAELLAKSGVNLEDYNRFTIVEFITCYCWGESQIPHVVVSVVSIRSHNKNPPLR